MDDNENSDLLPNLEGKLPQSWESKLVELSGPDAGSRNRGAHEARLNVWILLAELRAHQKWASATEKQAAALIRATWVLVVVTLMLGAATVAAALIVA